MKCYVCTVKKENDDILGSLVTLHYLGLRHLAIHAYSCRNKDVVPRSPLKAGLATQLMPLKLLHGLLQSQRTNLLQVTHFPEQLHFVNEWDRIQRLCYFGLMWDTPTGNSQFIIPCSLPEVFSGLHLKVTSFLAWYCFLISLFKCGDT